MNVKFLQKALIECNGNTLFLQTSAGDDSNPNKWDLPGGNVEEGEEIKSALLREVREETAIEIQDVKPLSLVSFDYLGTYVIAAIFMCHTKSPKVTLSGEHQAYRWVNMAEIASLDIQGWLRTALTDARVVG